MYKMDLLLNALEDRNAPAVLDAHDLPSIAKYLKSEKCENVFLMVNLMLSVILKVLSHVSAGGRCVNHF